MHVVVAATHVATSTAYNMQRNSAPERFALSRSMYVGSNVNPEYVVKSVSLTPLESVPTVRVRNASEYESGCSIHRDCFGHMCRAPGGCVMVPQGLAASKGESSNDYLRAAKMAFSGDVDGYKETLRDINLKKTGHMRFDILGITVLGSARLIIVPQVQFPRGEVALPRNIARLMKVPARTIDPTTGQKTNIVGERQVRDGDWAIVVRPPSLTYYSTQPMRIRLWDTPTLGISPDDVGFWHGDFDGDEMHLYPVYEDASIDECKRWCREGHKAFATEARKLQSMGYTNAVGGGPFPFIEMTNVPMSHIRDNGPLVEFASGARMKTEHVLATGKRFTSDVESSYVAESIRGMSDVARQQLMQGSIGYMSRIAKIVAMCFIRQGNDLSVQTSSGLQVLQHDAGSSYGCPCLRAVSSICSVAQQAALDSHRAGTEKMASYDMISNMLTGGIDTIAVLSIDSPLLPHATWKSLRSGKYIAMVEMETVQKVGAVGVVGSYSPWILSRVENPFDICRVGLTLVCNYFSIAMSGDEMNDMCHMLTYRCEESTLPITCAQGLRVRGIGWVDHLMATSYSKIQEICGDGTDSETPVTGTCALLTGNFSYLNG